MRSLPIIGCILGIGVLGLSLTSLSPTPIAAQTAGRPKLASIEVARPNIVVQGSFLTRVEIWAIPTGTDIKPEQYVLLGKATRTTPAGPKETWLFRIPACNDTRLLATGIFAKGFDGFGTEIGKKSLSASGASAVHDALCGAP